MCRFSCLHVQFKSGKLYFEFTFVEKKLEEVTNKDKSELCSSQVDGLQMFCKTKQVCLVKVCDKKITFSFAIATKAIINQLQQNT